MIILLEHAGTIYGELIKRVKKGNGKLVIFLGFDIDSICSVRILIHLLRQDNVRYEIIPVMNMDHVEAKIEEFGRNYNDMSSAESKVKGFIMLNCGGAKDMSNFWFCDEILDIQCLIIDVHRPCNHNNIQTTKSILIFNDGMYELENCPKDEDLKVLQEGFDDYDEKEEFQDENEIIEENEYEDEIINEDDIIKQDIKKKRLQKKKGNLDTINEESQNEEDPNLDDIDNLVERVVAKKSSKSALEDERKAKRILRRKKTEMIKNYYSGNFFGLPSAYILFKIASQLHREESQTLWLLIISMTDFYLQARINQGVYEKLYNECHNEVLHLNQNKNEPSNNSIALRKLKEEEDKINQEKEKDKHDFSDVRVRTNNKEVKTILLEPDYRLCLYRHWNLFDSFIYSNYTLANLVTWKEPGKDEVKKLLTYIGIPLDEAKQKYIYMKNENKQIFKEKIIEVSNKFGLKDFVFYSFIYQLDQKTQLSASDFVYCLSALLEYPFNLKSLESEQGYLQDIDDEDTEDSFNDSNEKEENESKFNEDEREMRKNYKYENFWACYDFLSFKTKKSVKSVLNLAIKFQTVLIKNGTEIVDKKIVQSSKNFRYAIINNHMEEQKYFHNPISLEKLALFVMETHFFTRGNKNVALKPFILALLNTTNKTYSVAGVLGNARYLEGDKNQFAIKFKVCANKIGANLMLNNFDDCIIEVSKDDFYAFLEEICNE